MPSDDRNLFQRLREMGEDQMNRALEELMSSPRFTDLLGKTLQQALATKGTVDRNMQTILSLLNLPSKADYKKLATKIEALQGSLVNLNIKLDRMLAHQQEKAKAPAAPQSAQPQRPKAKPKPAAPEASSA
jgi:polyhydroxyalkanoate synthesis regulator phasin